MESSELEIALTANSIMNHSILVTSQENLFESQYHLKRICYQDLLELHFDWGEKKLMASRNSSRSRVSLRIESEIGLLYKDAGKVLLFVIMKAKYLSILLLLISLSSLLAKSTPNVRFTYIQNVMLNQFSYIL